MLYLVARLIPWSTVLLVAVGVVLAQLLGVDVIGMAGDLLADWLGLTWDSLLSW